MDVQSKVDGHTYVTLDKEVMKGTCSIAYMTQNNPMRVNELLSTGVIFDAVVYLWNGRNATRKSSRAGVQLGLRSATATNATVAKIEKLLSRDLRQSQDSRATGSHMAGQSLCSGGIA